MKFPTLPLSKKKKRKKSERGANTIQLQKHLKNF